MRTHRIAPVAALSLLVGIAFGAHATPPDSPLDRPQPKLSDEFDLIPKMLSAAKGHADSDPLKTISRRMTVIHGDLSQCETDEPVQTRERQVVRSLDELIAALERHCSGLGRGNRPNGGRRDSVIASGDPTAGEAHGVNPNAWQSAQLPPKLRKEILQSKTDGFPPGYESLLQSYYQQLAEEKSAEDQSTDAKTVPLQPDAQARPASSKAASP
ncbi:MAG TPA: hypothetical protein VHX65_04195 [Pirellulales bacterium]|nr:hypothetical protein [Pirellulales bacterium]